MSVLLRRVDGARVYMPVLKLMGLPITNFSRSDNKRVPRARVCAPCARPEGGGGWGGCTRRNTRT